MKKFFAIGLFAAGAILAVVTVLIIVAVTGQNGSTPPGPTVAPTQIERTLTGKTIQEDRQAVLQAAIDLLEATNAPMGAADYETMMLQIEAGELDMSEELLGKIRIVDLLAEDPAVALTIHQSLVTFASLSKQSTGTESITTLYENAADGIIVDQAAGTAYVPTTLFINSTTGINGFSLEFVYVDGQWQFAPYMTLDELRLALVYNGATATQ